jgi:hypothetical protein
MSGHPINLGRVMPLHAAIYLGKRQHYTRQALLARILSIDQALVSTSGPLDQQSEIEVQ